MKINKWFYLGISGIIFLLIGSVNNVEAGEMGYSVRAIIPDNQLNTSATYFDLKLTPGAVQQLELEIISTSTKAVELMVEPHISTTNQNGEIEFSVDPKQPDSSLTHLLTDLLSDKQLVKVAPKSTKRVSFRLTMPEKSFDGKLVGGFTIYNPKDYQEEVIPEQGDIQIKNIFSHVIGIQLRETEKAIEPELKLNQVKADLFNYRTAITANLQNTQAEFLDHLLIDAIIRKHGSKKELYSLQKKERAFAPNSNTDFPISLENQPLVAGDYDLELTAVSGDKKWHFTKRFSISKSEATSFNEEAVDLVPVEENKYMLLFIGLSGLFFSLLVMIMVYLVDKGKQEQIRKRCKR